jgi:hypothetical protein
MYVIIPVGSTLWVLRVSFIVFVYIGPKAWYFFSLLEKLMLAGNVDSR